MALPNYNRIGVYSIFEDQSQVPQPASIEPLYCLVGSAPNPKAPYNNIVQINDVEELRQVFGPRNLRQEARGNWFQLIAETMLTEQNRPIYMLNLRPYDETYQTEALGISIQAVANNSAARSINLTSLFNRQGFWTAKPRALKNNLPIQIAPLAEGPLTAFVVPAKNLPASFDMTVAEHAQRFPAIDLSWLDQNIFIKDLFVEFWLFKADFTDAATVNNPAFGGLLTGDVLGPDVYQGLQDLSEIAASNFAGTWSGSLLSEVSDIDGNTYPLQNIFNAGFQMHGAMMYYDEDAIRSALLLNKQATLNLVTTSGTTGFTISAYKNGSLTIPATDSTDQADVWLLQHIDTLDNDFEILNDANNASVDGTATAYAALTADVGWIQYQTYVPVVDGAKQANQFYVLDNASQTMHPWLKVGAQLMGEDGSVARVRQIQYLAKYNGLPELQTEALVVDPITFVPFPKNSSGDWLYPSDWPADAGLPVAFSAAGRAEQSQSDATLIPQPSLPQATIDSLLPQYGQAYTVRLVTADKNLAGVSSAAVAATTVTVGGVDLVYDANFSQILLPRHPLDQLSSLEPLVMQGHTLQDSLFPDGTRLRQAAILDMLEVPDGIRQGLLDTRNYDFKYLIDSFKTFVEPAIKSQLTKIAGRSNRFLYMGSYPFMQDIEDSTNPYFADVPGGDYKPEYLATGGNLDLPYTNLLSLPTIDQGAQFALFFAPGVRLNDGVRTLLLPAGPFAAMTWGLNWISGGTRQPYDAAAGESRGRIPVTNLVGLERELTRGDGVANGEREILDPLGINAIERLPNSTVLYLANAATAQQQPLSALSFAENAQLLYWLAPQFEALLRTTPFVRNSKELRDRILAGADDITDPLIASEVLEQVVHKCDTENNTTELRARGYLVLDTELIANNGVRFAVHRTIVQRSTNG